MVQFVRVLKEQEKEELATTADLDLRIAFCEYLAACTYVTLARAEDSKEAYVSLSNTQYLDRSADNLAPILYGGPQTLPRVSPRCA